MLFSPGTVTANDLPAAEPAAKPATVVAATPDVVPVITPAPTVDAKAILDAINADREAREGRSKAESERETYKTRAEKAEAALEVIEKAKKNRLLDPAGFLKKMGYSDRDLGMTAESIMFSLMPEKATPAHVANLVKAQREQDREDQEARDKARSEDEARKSAEAKVTQEKEIEARYLTTLKSTAGYLKPGSFPASQAWFADDHDSYAQELFATAEKLAEASLKAGQVIDVTPAAFQEVEKRYATRVARFSSLSAPAAVATQPATNPAKSAEIPAKLAETNHKVSEKDIIARAAKAAFGL